MIFALKYDSDDFLESIHSAVLKMKPTTIIICNLVFSSGCLFCVHGLMDVCVRLCMCVLMLWIVFPQESTTACTAVRGAKASSRGPCVKTSPTRVETTKSA